MRIPCENCGYFIEQHSVHGLCPNTDGRGFTNRMYRSARIPEATATALQLFGGSPDSVTPDMKFVAGIISLGLGL